MRVGSAVLQLLATASLLASTSCGLNDSKCKCGGYGRADGGATLAGDAGAPDELTRSEAFWSTFRLDGDWAESQPTLVALAESADLVATGTITRLMQPLITQGDAAEDVVTEATLVLEIERSTSVKFGPGATVTVTMLSSAQPLTEAEQQRLKGLLPSGKVVVMLRKRNDNGLFRLVNGFGLWAATTRSASDCPIELYPDMCERLLTEASASGSLEALAAKLGPDVTAPSGLLLERRHPLRQLEPVLPRARPCV